MVGDIRNVANFAPDLKGIDIIFHTAAYSDVAPGNYNLEVVGNGIALQRFAVTVSQGLADDGVNSAQTSISVADVIRQ